MNKRKDYTVFHHIYENNSWQDPESKSGTGSNLMQTVTVRKEIPKLIKQYGIKSMLDIPCGDFFWMKEIKEELHKELNQYYGGDIVEGLVKQNNERYADGLFNFLKLDIIHDNLPTVDLIFCRDCLVHLSYKDILNALVQFKKSGSAYLLTTCFSNRESNKEIVTGDWRPLNLLKFPFNFPPPLMIISENCTEDGGMYADKSLYLWELKTISIWAVKFNLFITTVQKKIKEIGIKR